MPIRRIPFGEWLPDLGEFNNEGLYKVKGAVNAGGRWLPNPTVSGVQITGNAASTYALDSIYGFHIHNATSGAGAFRIFVGTTDDILRGDANDSLATQRATAAGLANRVNGTSGWQFTSFGDAVYATCFNGTSGHFLRASTPSTNFATFISATTPTTYDPQPRFVSSIKNHLLIANVEMQSTLGEFTANTTYPNLVMWSATDDPSRWGDELVANYPETVGSSYQHLYDEFGPITGLFGGMDYAYIFKPRAIYRMDGPEWTFHPVVTGAGTTYPNSIARFYNDVYFWGPCGPARLRYGSSEVENIGLGKVQRAVTEWQNSNLAIDYTFEAERYGVGEYEDYLGTVNPVDISAISDVRSGCIAFICADGIVSNASALWKRRTLVLVFDVKTEEFSFFTIPVKFKYAKSIPRYGANPEISALGYMQHSVLDGTMGVLVEGSMDPATLAQVGATTGDSSTPKTITISGAGDYLYDWFPKFTTAYNPLLVDDNNGPITTRVKRVRVPFTIKRFDETVVDGYSSADYGWTVKVNVTVRSKNRYAGEAEEVTGSWTSSDTYQQADGWIDLSEGKGSTEAEYHQFEIEIVTLDKTGIEVNGIIVHLRDLTYFEVEYEVGNPTGSTYIA